MNNGHRSKLCYFKQIYQFNSLIAELAHSSWLDDIDLPVKIAKNPKETLFFQSSILLENVPEIDKSHLGEQAFLLFVCSLPKNKFNHFLVYFVFSLLKNDRSLLINGKKIKNLSLHFSANEIDFLLHEKEVKFVLRENLALSSFDINMDFIYKISFYLLKFFITKKHTALYERLKLRFPKDFSQAQKAHFSFFVDTPKNIHLISLIAQALFPALYNASEEEAQKNLTHSNPLANAENAFKITSLNSP